MKFRKVAFVSLMLPLVACGNPSQPSVLPPLDATPTGTAVPSPSVAAPVLPVAATAYTSEGATAFTRYAIDVTNYAYATGDTAAYRAIATENCASCAAMIEEIEAIAAAGGRSEGGVATVRSAVAEFLPNVLISTDVRMDVTEWRHVDADGETVEVENAVQDHPLLYDLLRDGAVWRLDGIRGPAT